MSQLILSHRQSLRQSVRTRGSIRDQVRVGQVALMFGLLLIIGILSLMYLMQFSKVATKGYQITRLEVERNRLMTEREVLNVKVAEQRSLQSFLTEGNRIDHMVQNNNPQFFHGVTPVAVVQ
jgi:hypothetical protein